MSNSPANPNANALVTSHNIGYHTKKAKTLVDSLAGLPTYAIPYQIFLGPPQTTKMHISDTELDAMRAKIVETGARIYVHSQYILNLCNTDDYIADLLIKNLQYANRAGCQGVVVHVGKSTTKSHEVAMSTMRANLAKALEHATEACPLLLETPAGQGTETLTDCADFVAFVKSFNDPRLRICVDTCHIFASGYEDPVAYIKYIHKKDPSLLKLVHFNDSKAVCGSCVDRHEWIGAGEIGLEKMEQVAAFCKEIGVDMVYEG
jgi:deoxyribonuclease-4